MKPLLRCFLQRKKLNSVSVFMLSGALLAASILASLCLGAVSLPLRELITLPPILRYIRIPRIAAAIFAGAGLAGAGVVIQTLLGNPLAGPNIIGVNSGAGFLTLLSALIVPLFPRIQPAAAFAGALCSVLLVYGLSRRTGATKMTLLLSGVVLNSLFGAASEALCTFFPDLSMNYAAFRVGGLAAAQPSVLWPAAAMIVLACLLVLLKADLLELLALGDETAFNLGVPVRRSRLLFLVCAAAMAGASVSVAGLVGFLGLIVPHAARFFVGDEIRKLFPLSLLWGSLLMLVCDTVARTTFAPYELSVGIVLSVIGAPIFIRMLFSRKVR